MYVAQWLRATAAFVLAAVASGQQHGQQIRVRHGIAGAPIA